VNDRVTNIIIAGLGGQEVLKASCIVAAIDNIPNRFPVALCPRHAVCTSRMEIYMSKIKGER